MNFTRIYAVFIRNIILLRGNPVRCINIFTWILIDVVLWGFITKYLNSFKVATFNFVTLLLGAIILWEVLVRMQQGTMSAFFEDVWSQNFLNYFASPLKMSEYIAGVVLTGITTNIAGFLIVNVLAGVFFGFNLFKIGLALLPFIIILILFGMALGIIASAIVLRLGPSAEWLAWPIPFIIQPFVGVFYPIATLPIVIQNISKFIPLSYVFEDMRKIIMGSALLPLIPDLIIAVILSVIYLLLAYLFFTWIYRYVLKNGLIARFSAETA